MGAALLWIGSEIWAVLGWWTLAVPVVLFAVVLAWAHHASKAALAEQKRLGKQSEKERQYEIEMAASEQRQQEINRHRQQGHLTDKEALLVRLAFNEWIKLPLAKSYREKVDNADQVFMDFVRFAVTQKSEVQPRQHKDKTKMKPTEKRSHSHGTARSPGVGARQDTLQPPAQGVGT